MAGVLGLLRVAGEALDYDKPVGPLSRGDPLLVLLGVVLLWVGLSVSGPLGAVPGIVGVAVFHALSGRERARSAAVASLYPVAAVVLVGLLLSPVRPLTRAWLAYGGLLAARTYGIASTGLIVLGELGPLGIQCVASRIHPLIHDTVVVMLRVAPLTVEDTLVGAWAQRLIGKGVGEALVGAALSGVRRAEAMRASLFLRGARPGRRSPLCSGADRLVTALALAAGLIGLAGALL